MTSLRVSVLVSQVKPSPVSQALLWALVLPYTAWNQHVPNSAKDQRNDQCLGQQRKQFAEKSDHVTIRGNG